MRFAPLAEFLCLTLAVVLVIALLVPAIGALGPLAVFPLAAWGLFFGLDAESTRKVYKQAPERFRKVEWNWALVELVERLGFSGGATAFLFLVEIPVFLLVSFIVVPLVGNFIFSGTPSLISCFGSGAGVLALAHGQAWAINRRASA
ncbi:unnamed protein product [marine sediment metagenome]|uniref:Uncharacterized protein n=1 Tax=marine sediment metagenome TaxID=412755 RepID=X1AX47_9ZZZZ